MKHTLLLSLLGLMGFSAIALAQTDDKALPVESTSVTHPEMEKWEAYFEERYFSKGIAPEALGEGTGYLPYLREKRLYDLRKDYRGDAGGVRRWEIFRHIRSQSLERGGPAPAADWKSIGPNTMEGQAGRMISHTFDPQNAQVIWAGSASGGLWRTENGGDTWQAMTDQIPSSGVGAVAVNPLNPGSILIGTGEGYAIGTSIRPGLGIFKSTDRGLLWKPTNFAYQHAAGVSAFKLVWNYADTSIVWLAATNGIWKSTDGGMTWILKKGDGTNHQTAICDDLAQHPADPNVLYAAIESDGIWKSTDGGDSWFKLGGGLPTTDLNFISLDLCRDQPHVLYASMSSSQSTGWQLRGLYRSDNNGDTWSKIPNAPNALCQPNATTSCQGWYDNVVAVSPANPEVVWLGGVTLWRSENGGQSWQQRDRLTCPNCIEPPACRTYVDQHDVGFDPQNPQVVYVFNDGGVAKSTDGGICFEHKNEGLVTGQLYAIASGRSDPGTVITGTQDHGLQGIKLSENTNFAWDRWGFLDGSDVEVHGENTEVLYGGWIDGKYFRTTNGVHTIATQITNGINLAENGGFYWGTLRKHPHNHSLLLGATKQRLYKTTNGGTLWSPVATMIEPRVFEFDQNDPTYAYAAAWSNNGTWSFWRSQNSGDSWAQTAAAPGWRVTDIKSSPAQAGLLYVSRNSSLPNVAHIYKSIDFGNSWTPIQGNLPDLPVNAIALHSFAPGVLFAATDLGVFITTDDGLHWTEYNDNLPVTFVLDIEFNPVDTMLRIATLGRGAWATQAWRPDLATTTMESGQLNFGISSLTPNPASEAVLVHYFLGENAYVQLDVLNSLGQPVATLFSGNQPSGTYSVSWIGALKNGLRAQTGVYFVRLATGGEAVVKKLIWR